MVNSFVSGVKELDDGVVCLEKGINEGSAAASNNGLISLIFSFCIPFLYYRRGWSPFPGQPKALIVLTLYVSVPKHFRAKSIESECGRETSNTSLIINHLCSSFYGILGDTNIRHACGMLTGIRSEPFA